MYTVRIKSVECYDVVTDKKGLENLIALLDVSPNITAFQVWCAGIGMIDRHHFGWNECEKWTTEPLYIVGQD